MKHEQHEHLAEWGFIKSSQIPSIYEFARDNFKAVWDTEKQVGYYKIDNEYYNIKDFSFLEDIMEYELS